jgi:hypothetical protein
MSKSAMRHHLMARRNPLSENGRIVPAGLQYAGLGEMVGKGMDMVKTPLGIAAVIGLVIWYTTQDKKKANPRRRRNGTKKGMRRKTARKAYMKNPKYVVTIDDKKDGEAYYGVTAENATKAKQKVLDDLWRKPSAQAKISARLAKKNPRRRRNASAHQKRAKEAMNLFHSGEARSLKAAWKLV